MLLEHAEIIPAAKCHYGPFYDMLTVRNSATGVQITKGGSELVPMLLGARQFDTGILSPSHRFDMYLINMIHQIYGKKLEFTESIPVLTRPLVAPEFYTLTLSEDTKRFPDRYAFRADFREMEFLGYLATDSNNLACDESLNAYIEYGCFLNNMHQGGKEQDDGEENKED